MIKSFVFGCFALLCSASALAVKPLQSKDYVDSVKCAHANGPVVLLADSVRFDTRFASASLDSTALLYADSTESGVTHIYRIKSRSDPRNPFDSAYQTSGRWFYFRMVGALNKTIHLLFENSDPMAPVYSYDGHNFARFDRSSLYRASQHFKHDTVYVAYCMPYTLDRLNGKYAQWLGKSDLESMSVVGFSDQNRPLYLLTVRDGTVAEADKKQVYIHARIHPGETPSSFVAEGLIDALLSGSERARALLKRISFYIIACANPDGVDGGFSRSTAAGVNLESNFFADVSPIQKETEAIRQVVDRLDDAHPLDMALNLHAQIAPKMMFWLHTAKSTSAAYYNKEMAFFHTVAANNPLLNPADSVYSNLHAHSIERHIWQRGHGRTLALTLELGYTHYNTTPLVFVTPENLIQTGERLVWAVGDFLLRPSSLDRWAKAYPNMELDYVNDSLVLSNGRRVLCDSTLDQSLTIPYPKGALTAPIAKGESPGRVRSEPLLKAMYGGSQSEVEQNLVTINWCPKLLKNQRIRVTSVNGVDLALKRVSDELELHPEWEKYLTTAGTYNWRVIRNTNRLSAHSFGIAIDIGVEYSHYWLLDNPQAVETSTLAYRNRNEIPQGIIDIFERNGFIWGGKWYHYDTMHFEYRPELLDK